jgi:Nucleotidyltransferase domain
MARDLVAAVRSALLRDRQIRAVELVGSRAAGTAQPRSDWDFAVAYEDFEPVAERLPSLVQPLEPLAAQWDPLGTVRTYMLMLKGPVKVDLIFDVPQEESPPWVVSPATRPLIDGHFWDWTLWLAAKEAAGNTELVQEELPRLHRHLLEPLGVSAEPRSLDEAIADYLAVREEPSALEREVLPALARRGA